MQSLKHYIKHPSSTLAAIIQRMNYLFPSDKLYLKIIFRLRMGYKLDLDNPKTFSEKLQWLKLFNRKPEYTQMVDKYEVKNYVANIIGEEYIIPTLGVWDRFEDIDFDKLPKQFVLKTTHDGGSYGIVICKDKDVFDYKAAKKTINRSLRRCSYKVMREWPYKNVKRRIIAEEFIETDNGELKDYKLFCFNGIPRYCQVIAGRETDITTIDWYDREWNHQHFHEPKDYPFSEKGHGRPSCLSEMWNLAAQLSQGQPFLRVDFYEINNTVKFGELTFFPTSGFGGFYPVEWDYIFGSWIELPSK